jgi:uncharacterized protein
MARQYEVVSADSHLDLSPDQWKHRVPSRWRDQAPRVVRMENGEDAVLVGDRPPLRLGFVKTTGVPREEFHKQIHTFENSAGSGSPGQRLREQDQDGIDAEILYSRVGFLRGVKNDEAYVALNHAYNEYLAEEYSAVAPDRLIPLGVIPTSGVEAAVRELEFCAKAGMKGVILDRFPSGRGFPTAEDDRFWAAALDHRIPVSHHTGGGTTRMTRADEPTFHYARNVGMSEDGGSATDPMRHWLFRFCGDAACAPVQMAFEGVWDRFPGLQIYWAETMIGWLEYALWQIDEHYERYKYMAEGLYGLEYLERMPSEYLREHCLWGFLYDPIGVRHRDAVGSERVLWGSDFPHSASDWPHSHRVIEENFAGVPEGDRRLMVAGNAVRFFHLDEG